MKTRSFSPWLLRTSVLAMGVAIVAFGASGPVSSQSFNGSATVVAGQVDDIVTGTGTTTVLLNTTSQAVIDWTPNESTGTGPINFQAAGTTATFQRNGGQDFSVLNRIIPSDPTRAVIFDGTVNGRVGSGFANTGGAVYFYSPGGIILGQNAIFDVGALGLSTAPPFYDSSSGNFINSGQVIYGAAAAGTAVTINSGAQITAPVDGSSYVALFAPVITQNGVIDVNGSTALVAASSGTLTWNNGLFNIQVAVGTDGGAGGNAITHGGRTGGSVGASSLSDPHRVYMVAVPKNSAITTLIESGSTIGFNVASAAANDGNAVILSSGFNVSGNTATISSVPGAGAVNTITVTNATLLSRTDIYSANDATVQATGGGTLSSGTNVSILAYDKGLVQADGIGSTLNIGGALSITGNQGQSSTAINGGTVSLSALNGASLIVSGSATLDASAFTVQNSSLAGNARGGTASLIADQGSSIQILGNASLNSDAQGASLMPLGTGTGGMTQISATGGNSSITIGGTLLASSVGYGGSGATGAAGFGGTVDIFTLGGANNSIGVDGFALAFATGYGGAGTSSDSGAGTGGDVTVRASSSGALTFGASLTLAATGVSGNISNTAATGAGMGGQASLLVTDADATVTVAQGLTVNAQGYYADNPSPLSAAGLVKGGTAAVSATAGRLTVAEATTVSADGTLDTSNQSGFSGGGAAIGGSALISATGTGSLAFNGGITFSANGDAGAALTDGVGSTGRGHIATLTTDGNGSITAAYAIGSASGNGGSIAGAAGGEGIGGTVSLGQSGASTIAINGPVNLAADGFGGGIDTTGGAGRGGVASIYGLGSGTIGIGDAVLVSARGMGSYASGGSGPLAGGTGTGGSASIMAGGSSTITLGGTSIEVNASATGGGVSGDGAGGDAVAGQVLVGTQAAGAQFITTAPSGTMSLLADAFGGSSFGDTSGGRGTGGTVGLAAAGGTVTIASLVTGSAQGTGGGILNGIAGTGKGGRVALSATDGGAITFSGAGSSPLVSFNASGTGGYAEGQSGTAGDGESGLTEVSALSGGVIAINGAAALNSDAFGGNGGTGGAASGNRDLVGGVPVGAVSVSANGGTITVTGALTAEAQATGGRGFSPAGAGGSAQGGAISIAAAAGGATNSAITLNDVTIVADGLGGAGGSALPPDEPGNGGAGGAGFGGSVTLLGQAGGNSSASTSGLLTTGNVTLSANGIGGTGGNGDAGGAGGAGTAGVLSFGANSLVGANGSGGAVFGNVTGTVNAVGGDGGAGSSGTGGVGGNAIANAVRTQLIADGASVSAGTVSLTSGASGGAGQGGSSGGNATSNGIDVIVNGRAGDMVRGALNLASFQSATQSQVSGSAPGTAYFGDGSTVSVTNGDVTTGSFGMTVGSGVAALSAVAPSRIFLRNATFNGTGAFSVSTPGNLSVFADNSALNVSTISLHAADFVADPISGGAFQPGVLAAAGGADIVSANNIILSGSLHTGSSLSLNASGFISASDLQSAGDVLVEGQMGVTLRDLTSGGMIDVDSGAAIAIRNAVAGGDVVLDALGNIDAGALMAGASVLAQSGGNIVVSGLATAGIVNPSSAAGTSYDIGMGAAGLLSTADLRSAGRIGLAAGSGTLDTGLISAGTDVLLLSGGNMTVGGISSAGGATSNIYIASSSMLSGPPTEDFDPAPIFAATPVALAGDVTIGGPVMGGALRLAATGRVTLGDVTTNGEFVGSGGAITTGNMSVGGLLQLTGAGDIGLGTATGTGDVVLSSSAGSVALASVAAGNALLIQANGPVGIAGAASAGVNGSVGIASGGDIGFGSLSAGRDVTLVSTSGAIRGTGAIASGTDVLLLARTGATTGGISTPATGRITIADSAMAALGGSFGSGFDTAAIFAATPVSMNGAIVITDAVTTGTLNMAGLTGISLTSVTASNAATIRTENGLLSLSAVLRSPVISLLSNDIAIGNDAGINAGLSGTVIIASSNATGMRIGDAATGGGYVLDRAEFSRINSGTLTIGGPATASARIAMTIGDLDVTGPLAGSTIDAPDGKVVFFTGDLASGIRSGVIRVTGSLRARGFLPTNGITFSTGRFEMDAQTGLVEIVGQGTALGGTITFDTPQVNVAEAAILNRLAQDPRYAGRAVDLNTPLAAAHPGGIIRAGVIDVSAANAVLIQNSGTANQPAGFLATSIVGLSRNGNSAPGALDFIINGQLVGTNGTVTGKDVLDLLVQDSIRANFTPESSINACLISTISCLVVTPNADADADALAGRFLQSDNLLVTNERLGGGDPDMARGGDASGETEEQRRQREQVEQEISKAPILPPTPIIDSGPLDPPINVDEPVAGSGNPALINGAADTVIGRGKL